MTSGDSIHAPGNESAWRDAGYISEDLPPFDPPHAYVDGIAATALQYHAQANLYMRGSGWAVPTPGRPYYDSAASFDRILHQAAQKSVEFTVEVDRDSYDFDLLMFGMTRQQHDLLRRLNIRWKYRIDPGTPESARRYLGGIPAREGILTPVIVTVDGRDTQALAEVRPGATTLYPAHPNPRKERPHK